MIGKENRWAELTIIDCVDILDNLRKPVNSSERAKRQGTIPYYGATGQVGFIDDNLFDEELVLVGEDAAPFFDKLKNVAFKINGKSWVNNHAHVLRAKDGITINNYILHYLNHFDYTGYVGGSTRLKLTQGSLREIPIFLPPLAEQKRIVAKLDEALKHIEILKSKLDHIPVLLKQFKQTLLTHAVTGKLTEEWRKGKDLENEFSNLLNGEMRKFNFKIQDEWTYVSFNTIAKVRSNLVEPSDFLEMPLVAPDNIESETGKLLSKPTVAEISPISPKHYFKSDIIIYSKIRPYLSKVIIADFDGLCSADMYPITTDLNLKYLYYYMLSKSFLSYATTAGERSVLPKINQKGLGVIPVPVPSLAEQKEIVNKIDSLFSLTDKIETQFHALNYKLDKLPQALLAKAFKGDLVTQDKNDEQAKNILGRLDKISKTLK